MSSNNPFENSPVALAEDGSRTDFRVLGRTAGGKMILWEEGLGRFEWIGPVPAAWPEPWRSLTEPPAPRASQSAGADED